MTAIIIYCYGNFLSILRFFHHRDIREAIVQHSVLWVIASSLILFVAPPLAQLGGRVAVSHRLSAFINLGIGLLVVAHLVPECYRQVGWWAVVLCLSGFSIPFLIEHSFGRCVSQVHVATKIAVLCALVLHGHMDGALLASILYFGPLEHHTKVLALLLLHKIPVSLAAWNNSSKDYRGWAVLILLAFANLSGFFLSSSFLSTVPTELHYGFLALGSGALLHLSATSTGHRSPQT